MTNKNQVEGISLKCWNVHYTSICGKRFFSYTTPVWLCANKYTRIMLYILLQKAEGIDGNYFYLTCNSYLAQLNQLEKPNVSSS